MAKTEHLRMNFVVDHKDDGTAIMSVHWHKNGHETGVWIRYDHETSHKEAFSTLAQGMWEALQDPDAYNVEQEERGETKPAPYWDGLR